MAYEASHRRRIVDAAWTSWCIERGIGYRQEVLGMLVKSLVVTASLDEDDGLAALIIASLWLKMLRSETDLAIVMRSGADKITKGSTDFGYLCSPTDVIHETRREVVWSITLSSTLPVHLLLATDPWKPLSVRSDSQRIVCV